MVFKNIFRSKLSKESYGIETDDQRMFDEVETLIKEDIKHFVKSHNGKINLIAVKDNNVYIKLSGTCSSCPAIEITMNGFIRKIMKEKLLWFDKVFNV
jgi:Fe-S cluster biogenesis protein NfuA